MVLTECPTNWILWWRFCSFSWGWLGLTLIINGPLEREVRIGMRPWFMFIIFMAFGSNAPYSQQELKWNKNLPEFSSHLQSVCWTQGRNLSHHLHADHAVDLAQHVSWWFLQYMWYMWNMCMIHVFRYDLMLCDIARLGINMNQPFGECYSGETVVCPLDGPPVACTEWWQFSFQYLPEITDKSIASQDHPTLSCWGWSLSSWMSMQWPSKMWLATKLADIFYALVSHAS